MIQYTIAIVDDEETIRDSLELVLTPTYAVNLYEDAESFLASLESQVPDLVLMDIGLPVMSGIEALEKLKTVHPDVPVIMITAYEDI
ncbi:MAG: response regulator, partial [Desulfobacterales bacterium]|nr:response regulator [Desulfobacterales bacterium]